MDQDRAREIALEIAHPYFTHDTVAEMRNVRRLLEGTSPGEISASWESEHTDLGWVELTTWGLSVRGPWGLMWRNYDGDGEFTSEVFVRWSFVEAVADALEELASDGQVLAETQDRVNRREEQG